MAMQAIRDLGMLDHKPGSCSSNMRIEKQNNFYVI